MISPLFFSSFSSISLPLTQSWWDLSAKKFLSSHKLSGPLFPCFSSPPLSFSPARLTPERQQNVSALHLHVRAAFNKLNAVLTGHLEVISATPCILIANGVYHPIILSSSFACNRVEFHPITREMAP